MAGLRDHRDVHVRAFERLGPEQPSEPGPDHHDLVPRAACDLTHVSTMLLGPGRATIGVRVALVTCAGWDWWELVCELRFQLTVGRVHEPGLARSARLDVWSHSAAEPARGVARTRPPGRAAGTPLGRRGGGGDRASGPARERRAGPVRGGHQRDPARAPAGHGAPPRHPEPPTRRGPRHLDRPAGVPPARGRPGVPRRAARPSAAASASWPAPARPGAPSATARASWSGSSPPRARRPHRCQASSSAGTTTATSRRSATAR